MRSRLAAVGSLALATAAVTCLLAVVPSWARPAGDVTVSSSDEPAMVTLVPSHAVTKRLSTHKLAARDVLRAEPPSRGATSGVRLAAVETQIDISSLTINYVGTDAWVMGVVTNGTGTDKQTVRVYVDALAGSTIVGSWFDFVPAHAVQDGGGSAPFMVYLGPIADLPPGITDWNIAAWGNDDRYPYLTFPGVGSTVTWSPSVGPWGGQRLTIFAAPHNTATATATFPSSSWDVTATILGTEFLFESFGGFDYGTQIPPSTTATLTAVMHWTFPSSTTTWTAGGHIDARTASDVRRVAGSTRYDTAAALSQDAYTSATDVVVATGQNYADALSSSALAGMVHGPILLTTPNTLSIATRNEIVRLGATGVYIVGGEGAVSQRVFDQLAAIPGIARLTRLAGGDRYDTARVVGVQVKDLGGDYTHPFLARGDDFADALGLGPLAYSSRRPILLTKPLVVPAGTQAAITELSVAGGIVAGGTGAVSDPVADQVYGSGNWDRAYGTSRYDTAVRVAEMGIARGWVLPNRICVASGTGFPDGLAAGASVGAQDGLILLTKPNETDAGGLDTVSWLAPFISYGRIAGGTGAVSAGCYDGWAAAMLGQ
jgi:putative cell wall-binding protein